MIWITVSIALVLSLAALIFVIWPFLANKVTPYHVEDDELNELLVRKDGVMAAIKDLEFDHRVGKITDEDFERFDARLRRQAVAYMQQIEKLSPELAGMDASIEAEINRYRRTTNGHAKAAPASEPAVIAPAAVEPSTGKVHYCTTCGEKLSANHKFCANCGTPVAPVAVTQN